MHYLLTNPTYLGRIRHKALTYPGLHAAIMDQALWDSVQAKLQSSRARPRGRGTAAAPEPSRCLAGKLRDDTGGLLTPTHAQRHGRHYHYYISHRLIRHGTDASAWRLPAAEMEATLRRVVVSHLREAAARHVLLIRPDASDVAAAGARVDAFCGRIRSESNLIGVLIESATLHRNRVLLNLNAGAIAEMLGVAMDALAPELITLDQPIILRRRGVETRIIAGAFEPSPDPVLIRALADARSWAKALRAGTSFVNLIATSGRSEPYLGARLPLAFLAPKLQLAILEGRQPPALTVAKLKSSEIPLDWAEQERLFA